MSPTQAASRSFSSRIEVMAHFTCDFFQALKAVVCGPCGGCTLAVQYCFNWCLWIFDSCKNINIVSQPQLILHCEDLLRMLALTIDICRIFDLQFSAKLDLF
jgi:hypothetical protein